MKSCALKQLHKVPDSQNFKSNEETLDFFLICLPEEIDLFVFLDLTLWTGSNLENLVFEVDLHQDHLQSLDLHFEDVNFLQPNTSENPNHYSQRFHSQKTYLKSLCKPWNWQLQQLQKTGFRLCVFLPKKELFQPYLQGLKSPFYKKAAHPLGT